MARFTIHTPDTAPEGSREVLQQVQKGFGFIPNVVAEMAESPALVKAYTTMQGLLGETGFTPQEVQIAILSASYSNGCDYCMAAHSMAAEKAGVDAAVLEAMRAGQALPDAKLDALRRFVQTLVDKRGWAEDSDVQAFIDAGYSKSHVLDAIMIVATKTIANYTNHLAETPLDDAFQPKAWKKTG